MAKERKDIKNNSRIKSAVITRQVLKVAHDDWNTEAFSIDRSALEGKKIPTLNEFYTYDCIYFLVGNNDFNGKPDTIERVYVGQAGPRNNGKGVLQRLKEHDRKIDERYHAVWDFAIVVANKENKWGSTELDQIEHIFYNLIPKEHNLNGNNPNSDGLSGLEDYEDIINQIKAYLHYFSVNTFADEENLNKQTIEEVLQEKEDRRVEDLQRGMVKIPEIVTPISVVKQMVDILPDNVWNSKTVFLDPACKGGEFLREIYDRLMKTESLVAEYPDEVARAFHILEKQIFGIALSETSRTRAIRKLNGYDKNIIVVPYYIDILKSKTRECVVNGKVVSFKEKLAYEFGRDEMNFDVVIGNPPYQENNGAGKNGGSAIWNRFITMGIGLIPKYICMITPSRWFTGGMGLNQFRTEWLNDKRIHTLVHFPTANKVFPGTSIAGGVSYFLWDSNKTNQKVTFKNGETLEKSERVLNRFDVVLADNMVEHIVEKVITVNKGNKTMESIFGSQVYGLPTNWDGDFGNIKVITSRGLRKCTEKDINELPRGYRVAVSNVMSEHGSEASKDGTYKVITTVRIVAPDTVTAGHYVPVGCFDDVNEASRCFKYFSTKFLRLLVKTRAVGIGIGANCYKFVPLQDFTSSSDIDWSQPVSEIDKQLYKKYNLTPEEIAYIEKTIKPME